MAFHFWNIIYANCLGNHFTFLDASDFHSWFYLPFLPVTHSWGNIISLKLIIKIFVNIYMSLASFPMFDLFSFKPMTWFILRPLTKLPQFAQVGIYAQSKEDFTSDPWSCCTLVKMCADLCVISPPLFPWRPLHMTSHLAAPFCDGWDIAKV